MTRLRFKSAGPITLFLLANARTCAARLLDSRAHTSHTQPTVSVGPVQTALGSSHGCNPSAACPGDRRTLHPRVVAACHLIHTRPPDIHVACLAYQRSLSNPYFFLGLRRPRLVSACRRDDTVGFPSSGTPIAAVIPVLTSNEVTISSAGPTSATCPTTFWRCVPEREFRLLKRSRHGPLQEQSTRKPARLTTL
jgi:hypothetical protein